MSLWALPSFLQAAPLSCQADGLTAGEGHIFSLTRLQLWNGFYPFVATGLFLHWGHPKAFQILGNRKLCFKTPWSVDDRKHGSILFSCQVELFLPLWWFKGKGRRRPNKSWHLLFLSFAGKPHSELLFSRDPAAPSGGFSKVQGLHWDSFLCIIQAFDISTFLPFIVPFLAVLVLKFIGS